MNSPHNFKQLKNPIKEAHKTATEKERVEVPGNNLSIYLNQYEHDSIFCVFIFFVFGGNWMI